MSIYLVDEPAATSRMPGKILFVITVVIASIFPLQLIPSAKEQRADIVGQLSPKQGEVLWITIPVGNLKPTKVTGKFLKRTIPFFSRIR